MHILDKHLNKLYGKNRSLTFGRPGRRIGRAWAAVKVEAKYKGTTCWLELVPGEIVVLKADATVYELPDDILVLDPETSEPIPSCRGRFLITAETFDPYHLICDGWPER